MTSKPPIVTNQPWIRTDEPWIQTDQPRILVTRRRVLQFGAAATALLALPFRAWPFSQSILGIKKFAVALPGLGNTGIPVLTPTAGTVNGVATDVYNIVARQFTQELVPGVTTTLWGYAGGAPNATPARYLGGVIVATKNKPVRLVVTNSLPAMHILPVDSTLIDPVAAAETGQRQDRIAVHLHGGLVFWDVDGGPHHWYSNAHNPGGFVHGASFIDEAGPGMAFYDYPNAQSARMLWYHDHAYSLTRTNVFAGLASAYLITDSDETNLINSGVLPGRGLTAATGLLGTPLIIQDKTFWDPAGHDPSYASVPPRRPHRGDLWYPHVYESATVSNLPGMGLPPDPNMLQPPIVPTARWEADPVGAAPPVSAVAEYFSDVILVNGAPYPTLAVTPGRARFRILNASQGRFYNLQLYVADGTPDGITLKPTGMNDLNGNPILKPNNAAGPAFIQVGNETGWLPKPMVFSSDSTMGFDSNNNAAAAVSGTGKDNHNSNRELQWKLTSPLVPAAASHGVVRADSGRNATIAGKTDYVPMGMDPTLLNANHWNLLLAAAERADVVIDFRGFESKSLILYSDAPAPFPGGDIRNDYYNGGTGGNDLTILGGAPATVEGMGPDTRVLMRFDVGPRVPTPVSEPSFEATVAALERELPVVFKNRGDTQPLVPTSSVQKTLIEIKDPFGRLQQFIGDAGVNTVSYLDTPTDVVNEDETQEWEVYNTTGDTHPMHIHLVNFEVVSRAQWEFNPDGTPVIPLTPLASTMKGPDPNEMGRKEVVRMNPGEVTTLRMKFSFPAGTRPANSPRLLASYGINGAEYVWHCHILEHEEHDMMHPLVVIPKATK